MAQKSPYTNLPFVLGDRRIAPTDLIDIAGGSQTPPLHPEIVFSYFYPPGDKQIRSTA